MDRMKLQIEIQGENEKKNGRTKIKVYKMGER